jgi:hypothetical protein
VDCARWVVESGASNDQSDLVGALGAVWPRPPWDSALAAQGVWPAPPPPPTGLLDGGLPPLPLPERAIGLLAPGLPRCTSLMFKELVPYVAMAACGGVYAAHRSTVGGPGGATSREGEGEDDARRKRSNEGDVQYCLVDGFRALSGVAPWPEPWGCPEPSPQTVGTPDDNETIGVERAIETSEGLLMTMT